MNIEIEALQSISLKPGETLVVKYSRSVTSECMVRLVAIFNDWHKNNPDVQVIFVPNDVELSTIGAAPIDEPITAKNEGGQESVEDTIAIFSHAGPVAATRRFMYMPGGVQSITPVGGGIGLPIDVLADRAGAAALQAQHEALTAKGKRPYFDLNHEDGPASFWPERYEWSDTPAPGIYVSGELTGSGRAAIEGKDYRQFSPVFHVDNKRAKPARIVCREDAKPNMGGFVNDPAFNQILPLWAKNADGAHPSQQKENLVNMTPEQLAALQAKNTELQKEIDALKSEQSALKAKQQNDELVASKIEAKEALLKASQTTLENESLKAKAAKLEADDLARRQSHAKQFVADMVKRGAVAAKDTAALAEIEKNVTDNPATFEPIYAKWGGAQALETRIVASNGAERIVVTGSDPRNVFSAYEALVAKNSACTDRTEKSKLAREMAAIYAAEFRHDSRIMDSPLISANSVGTLAGTLVVQRVLELLKLTFPALTRFSTDFSDQPASYNQTVTTRIVSIPTVQTYNTSTGWTASDDTTTDVSVTINAHKGVPITFDSNTLSSTVRNLFGEAAPAQSYALAKAIVDALYANITAANFTATPVTQAAANFSRADVINMAVPLNILGVPMGAMNRTLLLYSTYFGKLAQDNAIVTLAAFQKSGIITDGTLPDVHGFTVVDAPNLPAGSDHIVGFGGSKSALVVATRMPNDYTQALPGSSYGNVTTVTDPDLGISVMLVEYVDHKLGTATRRISIMYGTALGQANAGQLLTSQ